MGTIDFLMSHKIKMSGIYEIVTIQSTLALNIHFYLNPRDTKMTLLISDLLLRLT